MTIRLRKSQRAVEKFLFKVCVFAYARGGCDGCVMGSKRREACVSVTHIYPCHIVTSPPAIFLQLHGVLRQKYTHWETNSTHKCWS